MHKNSSILKHLDFMMLDLLSLTISFLISYLIKLKDGVSYTSVFNPYKNILRRGKLAELHCSFFFMFFNSVAVAVGLFIFKQGGRYSRTQLLYTYLIFFFLSFFLRLIRKKYLIKAKRDDKINVLIIIDSDDIDSVVYNIENSEFAEYQIKGIFQTEHTHNITNNLVYDFDDDLYKVAIENNVLEIFVYCKPEKVNKQIVEKLMAEGISFYYSIDKIFGFEPDNEELSNLAMYRSLKINSFSFSTKQIIYAPIKRFFDFILSISGCVFLIPIFIVVKFSYLINGDREPVIYAHTRIGKNGKEFKLYKFRSMVYDADEKLAELLKDDKNREEWEKNHKLDNDPRVTAVGKFIRKTSLDEFPQFINVLKGEMSVIGPRPLVPGELKEKNGLNLYERVKPGITGWWGCKGRSNISYEERLELEYYYVKNFSFGLDIICILKTIYAVLFQKGAK